VTLPSRLLAEAFTAPLGDLGFARVGLRNVWMRERDGIDHAVSIESSRGSWKVRWDVVQPAVGGILHDKVNAGPEVAYSGIVAGTAHPSMRAGVIASFTADDAQDTESVIGGLKLAGLQVAAWLDDFGDVPALLSYLTRDSDDRDPRVTFPAHKPLRLLTAAALAAVSHRPEAEDLAARAREALGQRHDRTTQDRLARLAAALA
jgi:hypothetical protein